MAVPRKLHGNLLRGRFATRSICYKCCNLKALLSLNFSGLVENLFKPLDVESKSSIRSSISDFDLDLINFKMSLIYLIFVTLKCE